MIDILQHDQDGGSLLMKSIDNDSIRILSFPKSIFKTASNWYKDIPGTSHQQSALPPENESHPMSCKPHSHLRVRSNLQSQTSKTTFVLLNQVLWNSFRNILAINWPHPTALFHFILIKSLSRPLTSTPWIPTSSSFGFNKSPCASHVVDHFSIVNESNILCLTDLVTGIPFDLLDSLSCDSNKSILSLSTMTAFFPSCELVARIRTLCWWEVDSLEQWFCATMDRPICIATKRRYQVSSLCVWARQGSIVDIHVSPEEWGKLSSSQQ